MTDSAETGNSSGLLQRYALTYSTSKKLRLAAGTSLAVATVLVIPDAISMLPNAVTPGPFLIRLAGLWLSVVVQWFLSFLGIINFAGFINRGIIVDNNGIQLNRFTKRIAWDQIKAISSEGRPFFSKLIGSSITEHRVHLFVDGKPRGDDSGNDDGRLKRWLNLLSKGFGKELGLSTKQIDSFLFENDEFRALIHLVCRKGFDVVPDSLSVVVMERIGTTNGADGTTDGAERNNKQRGRKANSKHKTISTERQLRKCYNGVARKQKLITIYVSLMLILFLGRNCIRNYTFNEAAVAFNKQDYITAKHYCELALKVDPTFAFAWDRMARAEFRMSQLVSAEQHWKQALKMKPDLVSAKVGLSNICMHRKEYDAAGKLLQTALRLEEASVPAILNMIELSTLTNKNHDALGYCDLALKLAPSDTRVRLVAAQTYMRNGNVQRAVALIKRVEAEDKDAQSTALFKIVSDQLTAVVMAGALNGPQSSTEVDYK
jgi:Putative Zn-dependent protease, contains TPR repeats